MRLEADVKQLVVVAVKSRERLFLVGKRLDNALVAHIFLYIGGDLALQKLLLAEALGAELADKACHKERQRREEEHCQRDPPVGHQHENERADDRDDTGKELQKELCETVADRVHVIDNAADEVAVRVGVDIRKRYGIELAEHRAAQVADGFVADKVDKILHQPLKDRHAADRYADIAEDLRYVGKEHLSLTDDAVDRVTDQHRDIQCQRHTDQRGNDCRRQQRKIGTQRTEYFFDRSICFHRAASFSVCWDRQMSR